LDDFQLADLEVRRHDIGAVPLSGGRVRPAPRALVLSHVAQREVT
jgi:hypothetical protein